MFQPHPGVTRWLILYLLRFTVQRTSAQSVTSRWGQATTIIGDSLFLYGGKKDQFNSYSYTSAPTSNDLYQLSLSSAFDATNPPWQALTGSNQGPALAWHTISAFNTSTILLFGGQPGPNSQTVTFEQPDSAALLDVQNLKSPIWSIEPSAWANQPPRRIFHSSVSAPSGDVFIIGGSKADGSDNGYSDHHVFNPNQQSFTLLPSTNAPPDIYGHASVILSDGRILVFGGYSQSQGGLIPLSTIWVLDTTQPTLQWSIVKSQGDTIPPARRGFAAVSLPGNRVLIHGGSDATLQVNLADGWILDASKSTLSWIPTDKLSAIGARRDHFAVQYGNQVIFGLGYGNSAPAPALLMVYDLSINDFIPAFTPPSPPPPPTATIPGFPPSSVTAGSPSAPPVTQLPGSSPNSDGSHETSRAGRNKNTAAIAVGIVLGFLALIACGAAVVYVRKRKNQGSGDGRFMALGGRDDGDGLSSRRFIPAANAWDETSQPWNAVFGTLGISSLVRAATNGKNVTTAQRRDMLADEDTREFGEWRDVQRREASTGSSWSFKSILGGRMLSRNPSVASTLPSVIWREKSDGFVAGPLLLKDEEAGYVPSSSPAFGVEGRPAHPHRQASGLSQVSYQDPFADPAEEDLGEDANPFIRLPSDDDAGLEQAGIHSSPVLPLKPTLPLTIPARKMSTVSERSSESPLVPQHATSSNSSHIESSDLLTPFDAESRVSSFSSIEPPHSPTPLTKTIIGTSPPSSQFIRRSDSWWARFSRTGFLDRRGSTSSRSGMPEILDPNPAPRLIPIPERTGSTSSDRESPPARLSPPESEVLPQTDSLPYGTHGKSTSSFKTSKTADSAVIEKLGMMDVAQRVSRRQHRSSGSSHTTLSLDTRSSWAPDAELWDGARQSEEMATTTSPIDMQDADLGSPTNLLNMHSVQEPLPDTTSGRDKAPAPPRSPNRPLVAPRVSASGAVAARIQAYERQLSQDQVVVSPTNTRQREERHSKSSRSVNYGFVPRPNLFVANPDHRKIPSTDS